MGIIYLLRCDSPQQSSIRQLQNNYKKHN